MPLIDFFTAFPLAWLITALIFGLLVGSFLNVVIYRLPIQLMQQWRQEYAGLNGEAVPTTPEEPTFNLVLPNSHCPVCKTPIRAWQNIPVISFLLLKGRCQHCQTRIGWRYPAVEILTGLAVLACAWHWGFGLQAMAAMALTCTLIALSGIDLDHQLLPDNLTLPLLWLGLIVNACGGLFTDLPSALWGAVFGYLSLWSVYWLFKLLTGKEGMGYGDFKLLAALGAWMGWQMLPVVILLSTLAGAVIGGLYLLLTRKGGSPIPFGPFLALAGWIALFWGREITDTYLRLSGL